jgi:hypothetical protein
MQASGSDLMRSEHAMLGMVIMFWICKGHSATDKLTVRFEIYCRIVE